MPHQFRAAYCTKQVQLKCGTLYKCPTGVIMIDIQSLNGLADKITSAIPDSVKMLKEDANNNIKAVLESGLQQMNLVSREEFDVQTALLERTQLKLQQLEVQLAELEKRI